MWDILRILHMRVYVDLLLEEKYKLILMMKRIRIPQIFTCDYWLPHLKQSGSEIRLAFGMVLREYFGYTLGYSIYKFLVLKHGNYFGTWEGYLF